MASSTASRWFRPEVYPLFAAVGVAVGICGFQLVRNICINPEVRINKEGRAAGVLENYAEGEKYAEHSLRRAEQLSMMVMPFDLRPSICICDGLHEYSVWVIFISRFSLYAFTVLFDSFHGF
ncbi:hypothetical protein OPV22_018898 [Ensete ventricosum]|uniref:NADH-ubiquinone reductase complex 1 MLRQ subunit n=1 Tax=Ensete ventricosum TaxID=4639 RepID=A0AAV8QZN0_ENSVE|nr:hypothetical protein OPV22_018898 [Ensete ventricosum]